ncbi:hypothetical protein [Sulfuriflexus sp.]|uniref:hypothetical protein n=1 Tax=Sulfuriflexus sp. TaxID=2015443 RepID=UPI0028CFCFF2|nr:hypothetical protein [Sulfuriflexus sp.]MDT8405310.1 hypothetical protein [Sulfuriflexus sp.]
MIIIITYMAGLGAFSHIVAGPTHMFYALAAGATPGVAMGSFFVRTLIGNVIGGVAFVAVLNYAEISREDGTDRIDEFQFSPHKISVDIHLIWYVQMKREEIVMNVGKYSR